MMINGTLLVQTINFIGAYLLLRFFFFKPVTQVIQQKEDAQKKQHGAISDQKNKIVQQAALKREEWQQCQHYFQKNCPPVLDRYVQVKWGASVELQEAPQAEVEKMREEVTKLIITKVKHVS